MNGNDLMLAIQEIEFFCIELQLFLDTHPGDQKAREAFLTYSHKLRELKKKYDAECGPLHNFGYSSSENGSWVYSQPWPWEA